jgi:hypothetical protein
MTQPPEGHSNHYLFWQAIAGLAAKLGVAPLNQFPGLWEHKVDEDWRLELNPHREPIEAVPPFSVAVFYRDWPFGVIDGHGGDWMMSKNPNATPEALIAALQKAAA